MFSCKRHLAIEALEVRLPLAADVVLSEFMASNSGSLRDFQGDSSDWIELHNRGTAAIDLQGWALSDDADNLDKWIFPPIQLPADAYLVVFASGKNHISGGELHTNFRLRAAGEFLALTQPDGKTVASEFRPQYPPQQPDVSYGLVGDEVSAPNDFLLAPTPAAPNSVSRLSHVVTFSHVEPTFVTPFELTLQGAAPGQSIVFTLDGSIPGAESSIYTDPILIDQTMQIRARIVEGNSLGNVTTQGYSRLDTEVAAFQSKLPILLIENFGAGQIPNKGFPSQTGADTFQQPRQASMVSIFDQQVGGESEFVRPPTLHERTGIRVRGAYSATFDQPGYALEFWDEQDEDNSVAPLNLTPHSDWVLYAPNPDIDVTLINNTFLFSVSAQMGHWAPSFRYVEAFVNTDGGNVTMTDHVGLYVIEDKVSRGEGRIEFDRFSSDGTSGGWMLTVNRQDAIPEDDPNRKPQHFHTAGPDGILTTPPNVPGVGDDIPRQYNAFLNFEDPNGYRISEQQRSSIEAWFANMEAVLYDRTDIPWNDPTNGYRKYIDVNSFIDYFILTNLSKNGDGFLLSMWLYNPDPNGDGKLTMGPIWDADLGAFQGSHLVRLRSDIDRLWYTRMFEDPDFRQQHIDRWQELRNEALSLENLSKIIDGLHDDISPDAARRDGVPDWPDRLADMKSWLARRLPAIDKLFVPPPQATTAPSGYRVGTEDDVYYTLDGSDPRQSGGMPSTSSIKLSGDLISVDPSIPGPIVLRAFREGEWSNRTQLPNSITLEGDVDFNGTLDATDVDLVLAAVASGSRDAKFDLNNDARVDTHDVTYLVESLLNTRAGDANLDGRVDFTDFLILSFHFGRESTWSGGNFDTNSTVDFLDFLRLSENFERAAAIQHQQHGT